MSNVNFKILFCLTTIHFHATILAAFNTRDSAKISFLPVPTLGYAPETKAYAGAVCQLAFRTGMNTRLSAVKTEFQYTQKKQTILELTGSVFLPTEKWLINFTAHSSRFPDYWWGIGIDRRESSKEAFNSKRKWLEIAMLKNAGKNWFIGPLYRYQERSSIDFEHTISPSFLKVTALGLQCLHDSRNNMLNPQKGSFLDIQLTRNLAGGAGNGNRILMDGRTYIKTGKKGIVAGRMAFSHLTTSTHFFDLALLGGDRNLRGYYLGRFRDRGMLVFNSEYRAALHKRWGLAAGAGAGTVFLRPGNIFHTIFKPSLNIGIRFVADRKENINLRIDYAKGVDGQSGFYFAFGEAF